MTAITITAKATLPTRYAQFPNPRELATALNHLPPGNKLILDVGELSAYDKRHITAVARAVRGYQDIEIHGRGPALDRFATDLRDALSKQSK